MDVVNHVQQRSPFHDIAIVSSPALPEMMFQATSMANAKSRQPIWRLMFEELNSSSADRFLDAFEKFWGVVLPFQSIDDKVHVLGHKNVGPKLIIQVAAGCRDFFSQP